MCLLFGARPLRLFETTTRALGRPQNAPRPEVPTSLSAARGRHGLASPPAPKNDQATSDTGRYGRELAAPRGFYESHSVAAAVVALARYDRARSEREQIVG